MADNKALGKGLSALISDDTAIKQDHSYIPNLPIEQIKPNPYQPRIEISPDSLVELSDSIRENGIVEPLIVTQKSSDSYELIAGERRLKAAKLAGLKKIPAVIKEATPQQMLELAIVENIQRADLNPLEEALAFKQLADKYNMRHVDIAKKVGLSRPAVVNKIRLLNLPEPLKKDLLNQKISEGHARALLGLKSNQAILAAYRRIIRENLSVRATEELVRRLNASQKTTKTASEKEIKRDPLTITYEKNLRNYFKNDNLTIYRSTRGGKVIIPFSNDSELNTLYQFMTKRN